MHALIKLICVILISSATAANAQSRLERLQHSLKPDTQLVPGVTRGLEGDPRTETWASRCDREQEADACWLVGVQLAPRFSLSGQSLAPKLAPAIRLGVRYLNRACELGSAEGCADLGDFYRFRKPGGNTGEFRSDLRIALTSYRKACDLHSAYGCYLLAEFMDRGIATEADAATARSQFQELCSAGLSVACYRAQQPPAPAYPYKVYSALDSSCSTNDGCWSDCKSSIWGACNKIDINDLPNIKDLISNYGDGNELSLIHKKACAEGADWGCMPYDDGNIARNAKDRRLVVVNGCKAGSEEACLIACTSFADLAAELQCETKRRTFAGVDFVDKSIGQRMRECFGGGAKGCFDFLPNVPSARQVALNATERAAYFGSALFFYRMACNAGFDCTFLADHYRLTDPNRARAYAIAQGTTTYDSAILQSFTPIERAMSHRVFTLLELKSLPDDVVTALDQVCSAGSVRPCALLGEYFMNISVSRRTNTVEQVEIDRLLKEYDERIAGEQTALERCYGLPSSYVSATVVVTSVTRACLRGVSSQYGELRAGKARLEDFKRESSNTIIYQYDAALKEKALAYMAKACTLGDDLSCSNHAIVLNRPNTFDSK